VPSPAAPPSLPHLSSSTQSLTTPTLPSSRPHKAVQLRSLANITGTAEQRLWLGTLHQMRVQSVMPSVDLDRIHTWITTGITLDFDELPSTQQHHNTYSVAQNRDAVRTRLLEYIAFGAVKPLKTDEQPTRGVQPLHVVIKDDRKPRLVIDLSRNLNSYLHYEHFSYSTVEEAAELSWPGCWYGKLDLTNCFLSFPLHPEAVPYFVFSFEGRLYRFVRMPFGLSSAPRICTLLLSVLVHAMHSRGIRCMVRYLDDFLFIAASREDAAQALVVAQETFTAFGLVVNPTKTEGPTQCISFLGIQLDSVAQTLSCTPERVAELTTLLSEASQCSRLRLATLRTLIGKLSFAAKVLPGARPFMRRMLDLQQAGVDLLHTRTRDLSSDRLRLALRRRLVIDMDPGFRDDAAFWLLHLQEWNGTQRWRAAAAAPVTLATDASLGGWGFYLESVPAHLDSQHSSWPLHLRVGSGYSGSYAPEHHRLHSDTGQMTWCELFAVYAALHTYAHLVEHQSVLMYVDNATDVAIINRQGTSSSRLAGLLREIYALTLRHNIHLRAEHRSGVDNVLADFLSRPEQHQHRHMQTWTAAHTESSGVPPLCHVTVVSSRQFVNKQLTPLSR
jgi:hypothetical protein